MHSGALYGCRGCGTLLLGLIHQETPEIPHFVDVTNRWDEIQEWYNRRRDEMNLLISELEMQLIDDVHQMLGETKTDEANAIHPSKGLTLVKC